METAQHLIHLYGYWAVFIWTFIEGETALIAAAALAAAGLMEPWKVIAAGAGGEGPQLHGGKWPGRGAVWGSARQVLLGVLAALLSSLIILGGLSLSLVEGGLNLAMAPTAAPTTNAPR